MGGDIRGDHFPEQGKATGFLQGKCVFLELDGFMLCFTKFAVTAEVVDTLGEQADVAKDWDAGVDDVLDLRGEGGIGFNFDGLGSAFLHKPCARLEGLGLGKVGVGKREVGDQEAVGIGPVDGCRVVEDVFELDLDCGFKAEQGSAEGIADEEQVDAGPGGKQGGGRIIGREGGDGIFPFGFTDSLNGFLHFASNGRLDE